MPRARDRQTSSSSTTSPSKVEHDCSRTSKSVLTSERARDEDMPGAMSEESAGGMYARSGRVNSGNALGSNNGWAEVMPREIGCGT